MSTSKQASATGYGVSSRHVPPRELRHQVFRGPVAVRAGLLTADQLRGSEFVRLFRGVYADARLEIDHRLRVEAAGTLSRPGRRSVAVAQRHPPASRMLSGTPIRSR